jgi:hypothetical protein
MGKLLQPESSIKQRCKRIVWWIRPKTKSEKKLYVSYRTLSHILPSAADGRQMSLTPPVSGRCAAGATGRSFHLRPSHS